MIVPFYRAFEDRYRGSRELILGRLNVYLPFIAPLKQLYSECPVLDLGCGRGEWLQVLLQNDFTPIGVDLDEGMLEGCRALNLPAIQGDALEALKSLPDESQVVVSGFHIAEHIPFDDLKELVAQALRVLKPGGLLILETPNAENIVVGTQSFYLDPTHERPIPHLLLSFLTEYSGFSRSKLLRLQESRELATASSTALMSVLGGASPDYAIVAQKEALPEALQSFDAVFEQDYGLPLEVLAHRYDAEAQWRNNQLENRTNELSQHLGTIAEQVQEVERQNSQLQASIHKLLETQLEAGKAEVSRAEDHIKALEASNYQASEDIKLLQEKLIELELSLKVSSEYQQLLEAERDAAVSHAQDLSAQVNDLNARLNDALGSAHHWWTNAKAHESRVNAILSSTSWRITWPMRVIMRALLWTVMLPVRLIKAVARKGAALLVRCLLAMPVLRKPISAGLKRYPRLHAHLLQFARHRGLIRANMAPATSTPVDEATFGGIQQGLPSPMQSLRLKKKGNSDELKSPLESFFY
jgi:O-antigen chain-terminating methyltransferase